MGSRILPHVLGVHLLNKDEMMSEFRGYQDGKAIPR